MNFSAYEKMPTNFKKLNLNEQDFAILEKVDWVVTEKVHGANFSFVYEDSTLKFAKRKEYLDWADDFFDFQTVVQRIEEKVLQLFEKLSLDISAQKYILYGELFGGEYPHPEVEQNPGFQAVQTGVYYKPTIDFCAFDIAFGVGEEGDKEYLDYETSKDYLEEFQLFYAQPLFIGKMNEAITFDTRINSTLPTQFDLPPLGDNLIEGIVVKPYQALSENFSKTRPILKIKNPEFEEQEKYHQAEKWSFRGKINALTVELDFLLKEMQMYVTPKRLESAISKVGALDVANSERVSAIEKEFLEDIFEDFDEDNHQILTELKEEQITWLKNRIQAEIKNLIFSKENSL